MASSYETSKDDLMRRLRKIEGQVKGIQRMVNEDKYCVDILIQIAAVRAATNRVGTIIFENHTRGCLKTAFEKGDKHDQEAMIQELVEVIAKFTK